MQNIPRWLLTLAMWLAATAVNFKAILKDVRLYS